MNNKKRYGVISTTVVCAMCLTQIAAVAAADIPDVCQTSRNQRAYDVGYLKGGNIVDQAWNAVEQDCMTLVEETYFKDTILFVLGQLSLPVGVSEFVVCHYYGYMAGAADKLKALESICIGQCVEDGTFIGEMAAMMFCELSIAFEGLALADDLIEGILTVCAEAMVQSCESTFENVTQGYITPFGECEPYAEGEVWEQAKHNQCVANPDTDTDTDTDTDEDADAGTEVDTESDTSAT